MLLTYSVCSVAVHGEGALAELSSSVRLLVMTLTEQLYHRPPLTNCHRAHRLSSGSLWSLSAQIEHPQGQVEQAGEQACTKIWNGCFRVVVSGDVSALAKSPVGKENLPLLLLWLHQREKPASSEMFNANYIADKREEMLFGVCFGFKWGSDSVNAVLLFVTNFFEKASLSSSDHRFPLK